MIPKPEFSGHFGKEMPLRRNACNCNLTHGLSSKALHEKQLAKSKQLREAYSYHMGVSKNMGTPKWMVYNGKPY